MQKQTWLTSTPVPPHPGLWCPGLMMPTDITWQLVSDVFKEQADAVSEFHSINISIIAKEKQIMKVEITITILARNFLCSVPSKSIRGVRVVNFRASHTVDSPHDDDDVVNNDYIFMLVLLLFLARKLFHFPKTKTSFLFVFGCAYVNSNNKHTKWCELFINTCMHTCVCVCVCGTKYVSPH